MISIIEKQRLRLIKRWGTRRVNRPGPSQSAASLKIGSKRNGNDGLVYVVVVDKNGRHRWTNAFPFAKSQIRRKKKFSRGATRREA